MKEISFSRTCLEKKFSHTYVLVLIFKIYIIIIQKILNLIYLKNSMFQVFNWTIYELKDKNLFELSYLYTFQWPKLNFGEV